MVYIMVMNTKKENIDEKSFSKIKKNGSTYLCAEKNGNANE